MEKQNAAAVETVALRWLEFNKNDRLVSKTKEFPSHIKLVQFMNKLVERDNFHSIQAYGV